MSEKIVGKVNEKIVSRILLVCCFVTAALMLIRCFFGVETTDEAYYIADAVNALHGNYPFAYNFSNASGMTLPMIPLIAVYQFFVPDLEGIFLFMRISFTLFRFSILAATVFLLKRRRRQYAVLLGILFLIPYGGSLINNWSYNTITVWLIFFVGVLLGSALEEGSLKRIYICAGLSGILAAFAEMAHPLSFLNILFFGGMLLACTPRGGKLKAAGLYVLGGASATAAVMGIIAAKAGFRHLAYGLSLILTTGGKSAGKAASKVHSGKWIPVLQAYRYSWLKLILLAAGIVVLYVLYERIRKQPVRLKYGVQLAMSLVLLGIFIKVRPLDLNLLGASVLVIFLVILVCSNNFLYYLIAIPPIFFWGTEIQMTNNSSPLGRSYYLIPIYFAIFMVLCESEWQSVRYLTFAACVLGACLLGRNQYQYVYRDVPLRQMDYRMESGIYKGIYTEAQRGRELIELEDYIHAITDEGEWIKFCDNVPMGYLFQDGKMCDIRTWDSMNYSYRKNSFKKVYKYFINREAIPDKLIYVDCKIDDQLSIEDDWKFNEFVNAFYEFAEETVLNEAYRVKIYVRVGEYEEYLRWAQDKVR